MDFEIFTITNLHSSRSSWIWNLSLESASLGNNRTRALAEL